MAADPDQRVAGGARDADHAEAPRAVAIAYDKLKSPDPSCAPRRRAPLASSPDGAADVLKQAAATPTATRCTSHARAALTALADFGLPAADGPRRRRSAIRLGDAAEGRRAAAEARPSRTSTRRFARRRLATTCRRIPSTDVIAPKFSTELFIDTDKGTIQVGLAVLDAPLTVRTMIELARSGYFSQACPSIASSRTSSCRTAIRAATVKGGPSRFATS